MTSLSGRLAPGLAAKLNLAYDNLALVLALLLATHFSGRGLSTELLWLGGGATALWVVGSAGLGLYDPGLRRKWLDDAALLGLLVARVAFALALAQLLVSRVDKVPQLGLFSLILWPLVLLARLFVFRRLALENEPPLDDVLIIGTGPLGRCTGKELERRRPRRQVLGYLRLPGEPRGVELTDSRVLGPAEDLEKYLKSMPVGEVFIAGSALCDGMAMQQAIRICERYGIPFAVPATAFRLERARPATPHALSDGYLHYVTFDSRPHQRAIKRLFDIAAAAAGLLVLSPLLLGVALIIKLTSRGPIFFHQERVGLHGRRFKMLKFRSMVVNAEALKAQLAARNEQSGPVFKIKNDPRITPIGRFIRKYSIDELPQLINVLRGDMSVVGPRPPVPPEVAQYEPWQRRRLSVRPGLTCIWQVSGRNQISFEEWMYLDMQYIDHWSLKSDMSLILKTLPVVVTGRGAS
jgi:exopolysaccharide biosynthesis polyprenyl glycosylphosphotransferase